jgi:hypothetical protein
MTQEYETILAMAGALRKTDLFQVGAVDCVLQMAGFDVLEIAEYSEKAVQYEINRRVRRDIERLIRRKEYG